MNGRVALLLFCGSCWCSLASAFLDVYFDNHPNRVLRNVSLGLEGHHSGHQCYQQKEQEQGVSPRDMVYTPNRRSQAEVLEDALDQHSQMAFTVVVGGHRLSWYNYGTSGSLNGLAAMWDSWTDNLFARTSNTTSFIFLLDKREFEAQHVIKSEEKYLDSIFVSNLGMHPVRCIRSSHHASHNHHSNQPHYREHPQNRTPPPECNNELAIDQGYRVYYMNMSNFSESNPGQLPFLAFVSLYSFAAPKWADGLDEDVLDKTWRPRKIPRHFNSNYAYVKFTNWYAHYLINLKIIDYFDYVGKIDSDVWFPKPFPETNIPKRLAAGGYLAMAAQKEFYNDNKYVVNGVHDCLQTFINSESARCGLTRQGVVGMQPAGWRDNTFWSGNLNYTFLSYFSVYWLGLYTAPEVKLLAKHWNEWHPNGMWDYRWGDQQWWPRPIAMFSNSSAKDAVDFLPSDSFLEHKPNPRHASLKKIVYLDISSPTTRQQRWQRFSLYHTQILAEIEK